MATGKASIGAAADGFAPSLLDITVPTSEPLTLRLTKGTAAISGTILEYPTDAPMTGAKISARTFGKLYTLGLADSVVATADSDGSFHFANLGAGVVKLSARDAQDVPLFPADTNPDQDLTPNIAEQQTTGITLRMFRGLSISGMVFDQETSEPISGASVLLCRNEVVYQQAASDAKGHYRFENLNPIYSYKLRVIHPGFTLTIDDDYNPNDTAVRAKPKADEIDLVRDLPMAPAVNVSGVVQNTDGIPIANASLEWMDAAFNSLRRETKTDVEGKFKLQFPQFHQGIFKVTAGGYAFITSDPINIVSTDIDNLVIVMEREATIEGHVYAGNSKPIPNAKIQCPVHYNIGNTDMVQISSQVISSADGRYRIEGRVPGKNEIRVSADGYAPHTEKLDLQAGEHRTDVDFHLEEGLTIEGIVLDKDDKPHSASLSVDVDRYRNWNTKADGTFKIDGLTPSKKVQLRAYADYGSGQATAEPGDKNVIIRLDGGLITVHVRVVDAITGEPVENLVFSPSQKWITEGEGPGGFRFEAQIRGPGRIASTDISISAKGYVKHFFIIPTPADDDAVVTLKLGAGAAVEGRVVTDPGSNPVPDVPVIAEFDMRTYGRIKTEPPITNTITDSEGRFTLANLPAGKVIIKAMPAEPYNPANKWAELKDGQTMDIGDISVGTVGTIRGRIVRLPSTPVPGQAVKLQGPYGPIEKDRYGTNAKTISTVSDENGRFTVSNLPPGRYNFTLPDKHGYAQTIKLGSGETKEITMQFGNITVTGNLIQDGAPFNGHVSYKNKSTGQIFGSTNSKRSNYTVTNIVPGDYQASILFINGDNAFATTTVDVTVPDQPQVTQNLVVPK